MNNVKVLISMALWLFVIVASAQVTFVIQSLPSNTPAQDFIYIAGNFTGWDAGLPQYKMQKNAEGKWSITLPAQTAGSSIEYKFTRGSWSTVEKGLSGEEIQNRVYVFGGSSVVNVTVFKWADEGGASTSTAAANVKIVSTDFLMPQFNRTRRIWIYFPPDYETSGKNYPVLYMHDGQNLFDNQTSFAGEWKVDETLNNLAALGKLVPIVVGIDNGPERMSEYTPWTNPEYGGGDGAKYMQFIVETLKPYIDQHFRTLPDRENTGIMGSSLGGLISFYGALKFQSTFSKAGLFSPSYWFNSTIWSFTHQIGKQQNMRFFQLCGSLEGSDMVAGMQQMNDSLIKVGFDQTMVFNKVVAGGLHNETLWSGAFGEAYQWLFNSYITAVDQPVKVTEITCFPNPVKNILTIHTNQKVTFDTITICDINGKRVKTILHPKENRFDLKELLPGTYMIYGISGSVKWNGRFMKQ